MSANDVKDLADQIFSRSDANGSGFDADAWKACAESGLTRLTGREHLGGSGGSLLDAAALLTSSGAAAARVPLLESDLLAGWLTDLIDLPAGDGPSTVVGVSQHSVVLQADGSLRGMARRVPWARDASQVVLVLDGSIVVVDAREAALHPGENIAEEPRDDLDLNGVRPIAVSPVDGSVAHELALRTALGKSLLMTGAAETAVEVAALYATERVQFGRPIARFQGVQQQLALAAGEVMAAKVASQAAANAAQREGVGLAAWPIAAAKVRCGLAAGTSARISHQVMGALGFTREHHLRLSTTRLWAWRDEGGGAAYWSRWLGERIERCEPTELWPSVVNGG